METCIRRRNDLTVRDLGSDMILYDQKTETFHILNGSARSIWLLLEDEASSSAIEAKYMGLYPNESRSRLRDDLSRALSEFSKRGLLRNGI